MVLHGERSEPRAGAIRAQTCGEATSQSGRRGLPLLLGRGSGLWDGLEGVESAYKIEATSSPSGVTHVTFARTNR